jgi:type IV pilus assembly protein PilZ
MDTTTTSTHPDATLVSVGGDVAGEPEAGAASPHRMLTHARRLARQRRAKRSGSATTENRKHPRAVAKLRVAFQVGDGPRAEARSRDLSLGGMFIETAAPPPYGTAVRVHLALPDLEGEACIEAVVRWTTVAGMGVQFGSMGARQTHGLVELLRTFG